MADLTQLQPAEVFHYFGEISKIPRGSGNEQQISDFLVKFAKDRNLEVYQDEALNVIIKKPGTSGYESSAPVIIQGHMDMVPEKAASSNHDFLKDPLELIVEGDRLHANQTTLGADNGIAVAYGLALLDAKDIPHPPIELLITTNEETGMDGAAALKADHLTGKTLLNIDGEDEGIFFVSCAGGLNSITTFKTQFEKASGKAVEVFIHGLFGGHSGLEIEKQRANAIKILGRLLQTLAGQESIQLSSISGGSKHNAIAREAKAVFMVQGDTQKALEQIEKFSKDVKAEYQAVDPDLAIDAKEVGTPEQAMTKECSMAIVSFLALAPNGVQTVSKSIEGLVESSLNMGVLEQTGDTVTLTISVRSSVRSLKYAITQQLETLAKLVGAQSSRKSEYPEWQYEAHSPVRDKSLRIYEEVSGKKAQVNAIHAGLECGLLKGILPEADMISFGPNMKNVHTPQEELSIQSVGVMWNFLKALLKDMK